MPSNKITWRSLLMNVGTTGLTLAGGAAARALQGAHAPASGSPAALAYAPGPATDYLRDEYLRTEGVIHSLACLEDDHACVRDEFASPVGMEVALRAPVKATHAPILPGATYAKGCQQTGYAVPVNVAGQDEPIPALFDTGSQSLALADGASVFSRTDANSGRQVEAPTSGGPRFAQAPGVSKVEGNFTFSSYGSGRWDGVLARGALQLEGGPALRNFTFNQIETTSDLFANNQCEIDKNKPTAMRGIVGMGIRPKLIEGGESFLQRAITANAQFSFSFAPCHRGANVFWGEPPEHLVQGPMAYMQLQGNQSHTAGLAYLEVGGTRLPFGASTLGPVLFDTGATNMKFPRQVTQAVANAIAMQTGRDQWRQRLSGADRNCIDLTKAFNIKEVDALLPKLTLAIFAADPKRLGEVHRITIPASNYLMLATTSTGINTLCPYMAEGQDSGSILGVGAMIGHMVHFDEANLRVGIGEGANTCV